jgi:hypothetical protein
MQRFRYSRSLLHRYRFLAGDRSCRQVRDPYLLDGPSPGPFGGRELVVGVGAGAWRGVQLVERINGEARGAQDLDPVTVTGMELYP